MNLFIFLFSSYLIINFIQISCTNDDILFDLLPSNIDNQEVLLSINSSTADQFEITNSTTNSSHVLSNLAYPLDQTAIKANFKLKKQKLIFGKKLLLWKRNTNRGYGAFLMLCGKCDKLIIK